MTSSSPTVPEAEEIGSLEEVSPDSTEGVVELLRVNDIASLGRVAYKKKRQVSGERVFHGSLNEYPKDAGYEDGELVEVSTESVREAGDEPSEVVDSIGSSGVDVLVGTSRDSLELHRKAHDAGLTTDVTVTYSHDDEKEVAESFEAVRDLDNETGGVRTVVLVPDTEMSEVEGPTTAYQDLRVVSAARLYFDDLNIRVSREDVTDKLAQTALEFGADDVGFVEEGEFDVELVIREAGFEPVKRGESGRESR